MNYKSFSDLSRDIKSNLHKIPKDVTLVVGVPRSGLLAANLISIYLNLPLTDIDSFLQSRILAPCSTTNHNNQRAFSGKILIVDDSVATGKAILDAKARLTKILQSKNFQLLFCCVYADPSRKGMVDIPLMLLERPRLFEWNLFHNPILAKSCVEIDGVLCEAFNGSVTNELLYETHLKQVQPNFIPKSHIACILTARPEKYRKLTEEWLQKNKIKYGELLMYNEEQFSTTHLFKAKKYKLRPDFVLFINGDYGETKKVFTLTGKDTFCSSENEMLTRISYKKLILRFKRKILLRFQQLKKG